LLVYIQSNYYSTTDFGNGCIISSPIGPKNVRLAGKILESVLEWFTKTTSYPQFIKHGIATLPFILRRLKLPLLVSLPKFSNSISNSLIFPANLPQLIQFIPSASTSPASKPSAIEPNFAKPSPSSATKRSIPASTPSTSPKTSTLPPNSKPHSSNSANTLKPKK